ncbi:heparinase II/III-family protein [Thioalkalicoccus limnaeus]|uniref:Heparinase II/III-family protein n=1 Tax=Thioalkalicoccus limnaeus TaxID=120681 RepID=A0ABV4BFQ2_9GAMM
MTKARTALALGLPNLARVLFYRLGVGLGLNPVRRLRAHIPDGPFFSPPAGAGQGDGQAGAPRSGTADRLPALMRRWWNRQDYFGWFQIEDPAIPHWHRNPFSGAEVPEPLRPWWQIPDFDARVGDIKTIWEASRFDWVLTFAQHASHGDPVGLERLNAWLDDWLRHNPPYLGANWKCGQEASIRVMHLAVAALILDRWRAPTARLRALVRAHLQRIAPTIQYAIAQDNNHGTSEAAALFIGGTWLDSVGDALGARWARLGRRWLENRATRLIAEDGSFSQYSVNYHRLMLDTYSLVECWRRRLDAPPFSRTLQGRLIAASRWLHLMTQPETGDAPVLGANDGARLLPLDDGDYRDHRPSVQLAMALFAEQRAYPPAPGVGEPTPGPAPSPDPGAGWNHALAWLGVPIPRIPAPRPSSAQLDGGGYCLLRRPRAFAMLRYPRFRFRPSQADALHLDLWRDGQNLLRDAGSYSYNAGDDASRYFKGTASHNTVQFDDRDQMPRLGRFLFGDWLRAEDVDPVAETDEAVTAAAGYTDGQGARHHRRVALTDTELRVEDRVSGFAERAVLRWRLRPGDWSLDGDRVRLGDECLQVTATVPIARLQLIEGFESRYYLRREPVPVLEVEVREAGRLFSAYRFAVPS